MKLVALPMLLIVGLLVTGVGYACWEQTIYVKGTVATGDLCWEWADRLFSTTDECGPYSPDRHCTRGFENEWVGVPPKDVGCTDVVRENENTVRVIMYNVYPCYCVSVSVYPHNCGSTPLIVENVLINGYNMSNYEVREFDLNGDGDNDIEIEWGNHIGVQLHYCNEPEISFRIHVLQDAPQDNTLYFTISLVAVQYNCSSYWIPLY
jgi:hypothetical protein